MEYRSNRIPLAKNTRSVSPVIGTIFVVAIVVVLAAVIGATAFGYTDELGSTSTVSDDDCAIEFDPADVEEYSDDVSACSASSEAIERGEGIVSFSTESDYWEYNVDNNPPDTEDGEYTVGSDTPIDFDRVETVYVEWEHESTPDETQDRSYIGVDPELERINWDNTGGGGSEKVEAAILNEDTNFDRRTDELDVSDVSGEQKVGVGAELGSGYDQYVNLKVYRVWGEDPDGEIVFELGNP